MALDDSRARLSEQLNKYNNPDELVPFVSAWYGDYKTWEARDTFDAAFSGGRMTYRVLKVRGNKVSKWTIAKGTFDKNNYLFTKVDSVDFLESNLDNTRGGVVRRLDPANFSSIGGVIVISTSSACWICLLRS